MSTRQQNLTIVVIASAPLFNWINHPTTLIGIGGAEVYGHGWNWWWRTQRWPILEQGTHAAVGVESFPAIDLLPLMTLGWIARWFSPVAAHNIWVVLCCALAAYGGKKLADSVNGNPLFGAMAVAWSAPFLGSISSGLTEDMALGLSALALAAARRNLVVAAGWTVATAASGLVLGWLTGALLLGYGMLHAHPWKQRLNAAGVLAAGSGPLLWLHWNRLTGGGHRSGEHVLGNEPFWSINPWKQADAASFFLTQDLELTSLMVRAHPGYLSWVVLLLVMLAGRKHWKLIALGLGFIGLALGANLRFLGQDTGAPNPIWMLWQVLPGAELLNHHARVIPVALLPLVAVAAQRVATLRIAQQPFLLLLLGCELCLLSPMGIFLPTTSSHQSSLLQSHQPTQGRWLHLPMSGPGRSFQLPLWLQTQHQQPLWLWPNRPGYPPTAPKNETIEWLLRPDTASVPSTPCMPSDITGIFAEAQLKSTYSPVLGPPQQEDQSWLIWSKVEHCRP